MSLQFHVSSWDAWMPGVSGIEAWRQWSEKQPMPLEKNNKASCQHPQAEHPFQQGPDVSYMPAMLRRRLSPIARAAMHVAWQCSGGEQVPVVFSSVYGESDRTFELTQSVAVGEPLSPASFSLSVHNAISGQFTIARRITEEAVTLSSSCGGILPALFEAQGMLQEGLNDKVMVVFYDQPIPDVYREGHRGPQAVMTCALLLTRNCSDPSYTLQRESNVPKAMLEQEEHLQGLVRVLVGSEDSVRWQGMGANWLLSAHAKN